MNARTSAAPLDGHMTERELITAMTMQRIEQKLDGLIETVGWEKTDAHGQQIGEGLIGRLMRGEQRQLAFEKKVEARFTIQSGWIRYAAGAMAAAAIFIGVIWWIIGDKVEHVVK